MRRFFRLLAGVGCLTTAGLVAHAHPDHDAWKWFLGVGSGLVVAADWGWSKRGGLRP